MTRIFLKKLIWPIDKINNALPSKGLIFDLGCGEGIISTYLAQNSKNREVIGVDSNTKRLPRIHSKNLKFIRSDLRKFRAKRANGFVISDVLHHLEFPDQKKLLSKCAKNLKAGGILIVKEIDSSEYLRSRMSRIWDLILYPRDKIHYWSAKDLENLLSDLGFSVEVLRPSRFFPGSTTLFICKKQ